MVSKKILLLHRNEFIKNLGGRHAPAGVSSKHKSSKHHIAHIAQCTLHNAHCTMHIACTLFIFAYNSSFASPQQQQHRKLGRSYIVPRQV